MEYSACSLSERAISPIRRNLSCVTFRGPLPGPAPAVRGRLFGEVFVQRISIGVEAAIQYEHVQTGVF
ncbi:hypothetical protein GCM10023339_26900 [Alloalcanivorax gelatiniphagus]